MTSPDIKLTPEQEKLAEEATEEAARLRHEIAELFVKNSASKVAGLSALAGMLIVNTMKFTKVSKAEFLDSLSEFWDEEEEGLKAAVQSGAGALLKSIKDALEKAGLSVSGVKVVTPDQLKSIGLDVPDAPAPVVQSTQSE